MKRSMLLLGVIVVGICTMLNYSLVIGEDSIEMTTYSLEECERAAYEYAKKDLESKGIDRINFEENSGTMFYYTISKNGIELLNTHIRVDVRRRNKEIYRYFDNSMENVITDFKPFDTSNFEEAKEYIRSGMRLGYVTLYSEKTKKYNAGLAYVFDDYQVYADDFTAWNDTLKNESLYNLFNYINTCTTYDPNQIIPPESIINNYEIEKPSGAISEKKAVNIYNKFFESNISVQDAEITYYKNSKNDYIVKVNEVFIDSKGRIISCVNYVSDENDIMSNLYSDSGDVLETVKGVIDKLNCNNYKLSDIRWTNDEELFYCYVMRNGLPSFNERFEVYLYEGKLYGFVVKYVDDKAFSNAEKTPKISMDEAFEKAVDKMELKPYYYNRYAGNEEIVWVMTNIYGFRENFYINADTGLFYDKERRVILDKDIFTVGDIFKEKIEEINKAFPKIGKAFILYLYHHLVK